MVGYSWTTIEKKINCKICKREVMAKNRQQKYCPECSAEHKKQYNKDYEIKRQQRQINKAFKNAGVML